MERNTKTFISILIICLLSVCSLFPLFTVTTSAASSTTDIDSYTPNGSVELTFHTTEFIGTLEPSPPVTSSYLHVPITFTSGWDYTGIKFTSSFPVIGSNTSDDEYLTFSASNLNFDTIQLGERITTNQQLLSGTLGLLPSDFNHIIRMDITFRDFYVFDEYFDYIDRDVKQSIAFYLSAEIRDGIYSSLEDGSAEYRYREVGVDALYTTHRNSSYYFTPTVPYIFDHDGEYLSFPVDSGVSDFVIDEFTNLAIFEEEKLYHFDYLTLSYFIDPRSFSGLSFEFETDISYNDVLNIDNIVVSLDSSNIHVPVKDLGSWLGKATSGFFSAEFIPGFSFGGLVVVVLSFALLIWFLKLFAGG